MGMKSVLRWGSEQSQGKAGSGQCSQGPAFPSIRPPWAGPGAPTAVVPWLPPPWKGPHSSSPESRCYSLLPHQPLKMCCPFQLRPSLFSCRRLLHGECPPTLLAPSCVESSPPAGLDVTFSLQDTCSVLPWLALERAEVSVPHPSPH